MAIYPVHSNYVIDVDIITTTSFKAGMVLMRDDNGRAIPADNASLLYRTIQQKSGKILGYAASDHDAFGNTIIVPDVIGSSYLDENRNFVRFENNEVKLVKRALPDLQDPNYNISNPTDRSVVPKRGIAVYNQPDEIYITDQFVRVLHGDFGQDLTDTIDFNPGDLLTVGSGVNAGKLVKVNINSIGTDIIVLGVVEKFVSATGLLHFSNVFYSITFSGSSAVMVLDAGNSLSFPNAGSIGTVCGTVGESRSFTLTAPAGHVFDKVLFASYGTPDGTCGNFSIGSCHSATSQSVVEGLLLGNSSVTLDASNGVFGDPCPGTSKRLYVQARFAPILAKDLTVNNNNGALTNGVTYDSAGGGSWSFDGTNDYINVPITNFTLNNASFTAMCWVNLTLPAFGTFFHLGDNGNGITMGVGLSDTQSLGTKVIVLYPLQRWVNYTYNLGTYSNGWNFVAISVDSAKYPTVYLNNNPGIYVAHNDARTPTLNTMTIGKELPNVRHITGKLTDVRLYNRPLSASEISAYYNATKSRYGL